MIHRRDLNGYVVLYQPDHPSAMQSDNWKGWIYEHVAVAEKKLGRRLTDAEVVHHLDLDRSNNDPKNLLVLERSQHGVLHKWIDRGAPMSKDVGSHGVNSGKSKAENSHRCAQCGFPVASTRNMFCSVECFRLARCQGKTRHKVVIDKPTKEQLQTLIETQSYVSIGKQFGVSDNAVRRWVKQYGLQR